MVELTPQEQQKMTELHSAAQEALQAGDIAKYNHLTALYNTFIETIPASAPEETDTISEHSTEQSIVPVGIYNILKGIVNNTRKGKYSEQTKNAILRELKQTVQALSDLDADIAQKQKAERVEKYSAITPDRI